MTPGANDLWFVPLGGTGEIGMNLNLYGHSGQWLMVDCGITFDEPLVANQEGPRYPVVCADPSFIVERREDLCGIIITHAHEDHIGALPHLWPRLRCPVYTTAFTAAVLRRKLGEANLSGKVPIIEVEPGSTHTIGPFSVRWMAITHSIPDPYALLIETSAGKLLHTADWKIDPQPVAGQPFDSSHFKALRDDDILALVGDSTNALKAGFSVSERTCAEGLLTTIKGCHGRVVVTCFGSNVARLISLARIGQKTGRYVALLGRSLLNMYAAARQCGIWPDDLSIIDPQHLGFLPPEEVLAIATGSQGEPRAALNRLALDQHHSLNLSKGDTVIFSAIVIPGNEDAIERLWKKLSALGVDVIHPESTVLPVHASGHPCEGELRLMYQWVAPNSAIPVHGEAAHLEAHAKIALASGVKRHYVGQNGDLYLLAPQPGIRRQVVKTGRLAIARDG